MTALTAGGGTTVPHTWWHWGTSEIGHRSMATVCYNTLVWKWQVQRSYIWYFFTLLLACIAVTM